MWDVKRFVKSALKSNYNIVELGYYIFERSEKVKLFDYPNKEFGILGVNNKDGVFDAYVQKGSEINQPYKLVYDNDLTYNPYRVNVGSVGMKTQNHSNKYISPAYVVFGCEKSLNSEFLYRLFKTNTFNKIINDNTTGSVRQNLKYDTLAKIKIPLPPLEEQKTLVNAYNEKIVLALKQKEQEHQLRGEIQEYLESSLKIKSTQQSQINKGLQFIKFEDISRWDSLFLIGNIPSIDSKYPLKTFESVISCFNKGKNGKSIRINSKDYPNDNFRFIGMELYVVKLK